MEGKGRRNTEDPVPLLCIAWLDGKVQKRGRKRDRRYISCLDRKWRKGCGTEGRREIHEERMWASCMVVAVVAAKW